MVFVLTTYHLKAHHIRDAVIVSTAWRDGATVSDVIITAMLTGGTESSYFIPRLPRTEGTTTDYRCSQWEAVLFVGWTARAFMQYRCPSLGSRHVHGFEMFKSYRTLCE
jgi:hypothetical protein